MVIDAKVIALLKESRKATDGHDVVHAVSGISTQIISTRDFQNALKGFTLLVRSCIVRRRGKQGNEMGFIGELISGIERYILRDGKLYIRLGAMIHHGTTKGQMEHGKVIEYINVIRWYINPNCCLCSGEDRVLSDDQDSCEPMRSRLYGSGAKIFAEIYIQHCLQFRLD